MNLPIANAVSRLAADATYSARFKTVYGEAPTGTNLAAALSSFIARQYAPKNRVDTYLAGDRTALTAAEIRGLERALISVQGVAHRMDLRVVTGIRWVTAGQ